MTLGIRPEDVALADSTENLADPTEPFEATVDVVEPVGDEVFVYLLLEERGERDGAAVTDDDEPTELLMSAPPSPVLTDNVEGSTFEIRMDRAWIHLFDAASGEALLHGLEETPPSESGIEEVQTD